MKFAGKTNYLGLARQHNRVIKGRYIFYWRGWGGASEGRVICKYFTNWGGSNLFYMQPREGHSFLARKKLLPGVDPGF